MFKRRLKFTTEDVEYTRIYDWKYEDHSFHVEVYLPEMRVSKKIYRDSCLISYVQDCGRETLKQLCSQDPKLVEALKTFQKSKPKQKSPNIIWQELIKTFKIPIQKFPISWLLILSLCVFELSFGITAIILSFF